MRIKTLYSEGRKKRGKEVERKGVRKRKIRKLNNIRCEGKGKKERGKSEGKVKRNLRGKCSRGRGISVP